MGNFLFFFFFFFFLMCGFPIASQGLFLPFSSASKELVLNFYPMKLLSI